MFRCSLLLFALLSTPILAQQPPVLLLNGFDVGAAQGGDCEVEDDSTATFGRLQEFLEADGRHVIFFDTCEFGTPAIEELGARLGDRITALESDQVDLVGFSMGGLIVRSYLSGKAVEEGVFAPPADTKVRKVVFVAAPHFGSPLANLPLAGVQPRQMRPGGRFLWDLATWNQGWDDLRAIDALAIVGSGAHNGRGDGVVGVHSASLLSFWGQSPERTRVVPACHNEPAFLLCSVRLPIMEVDSEEHPTAIAVRSFLADDPAWMEAGTPVDEHPATQGLADILLEARDADDSLIATVSSVSAIRPDGGAATLTRGAAGLFYAGNLSAEALPTTLTIGDLGEIMATIQAGANTTRVTPVKLGPRVVRVVPSAGLIDGLSLAPDSLASLFGVSFTDQESAATELPLPTELAGVRVLLDGEPLGLLYAGPGQVNALLPPTAEGLLEVSIQSSLGSHSLNVQFTQAAPAIFTLDGSGAGAAAALDAESFALIANETPIANGRYAALYVTGIGDAEVEVLLGGRPQTVLYAGPAPGFPGLQQINFRVQADPGLVELRVRAGGRTSNTATLAVE